MAPRQEGNRDQHGWRWTVGLALIGVLAASGPARATDQDGYLPLATAIHVHTTFSTGEESIEQVAAQAVAHGVEVVVVTDDDLLSAQYGLPFLRRLVRFGREERSVLGRDATAEYLAEIRRVDELHPELILIDGMESAPFYYWEVDADRREWTARYWNKHLLAVGLGRQEFYERLPVIDSGNLEVWHWTSLLYLWPLLGLVYGLVARRRHPAAVRYPVMVIACLALINNYPFKIPLWDQYHGDLGAAPYQHYIDYVRDRGGLVFWAHPESRSTIPSTELLNGRVRILSETPAHAADLLATRNYTGFAALYGDNVTAIEPGAEWDQALQEYLRRERPRPVWGTGEIDYHYDDAAHRNRIHDILTVVLARERSASAVLEALRLGRVYAVRGGDERLALERFRVDTDLGMAVSGETVPAAGPVRVHARVVRADGQEEELEVRLVRSGEVIARFRGTTPFDLGHVDEPLPAGAKTYYRLLVKSRASRLVTNPIFVAAEGP